MHDVFSLTDESHAWARMRQKRECPTMARLRQGGEAVKRHLKSCARCKARYDDMLNSPDYGDVFPKVRASASIEPKSGQIRKIREEAGRYPLENWDDELFSPPLVIILTEPDSTLGSVRVAQIHDEPALAGSGDVPIEMPVGMRFAEGWNTYPMFPELLGPVLYTVSSETVSEIIAEGQKPLPNVDENEFLEAFRELEVEVGYHYSQLSVAQSLERLDNAQDGKKSQDSARIIPFAQASKSKPDKKTIFFKSHWKPLASAACVVLLIGSVFLNKFILLDEDAGPVKGSFSQSSLRYSHEIVSSSESSHVSALSAQKSLISALQLYLASGGDTTRGKEESQPFDWEKDDLPKDVPPKWQAFAAGQWSARAALSQTESPFPSEWLPEHGDISSWQKNSYFALGFTAYAADLACHSGRTPSDPLANALAEAGIELEKRLNSDISQAIQFSKSLQDKPLSCDVIQEILDEIDAISPLY